MAGTDTENRRLVTQQSIDASNRGSTPTAMSDTNPLLEQLPAIRDELSAILAELRYQGQRLSAIEKRFATLCTTTFERPSETE